MRERDYIVLSHINEGYRGFQLSSHESRTLIPREFNSRPTGVYVNFTCKYEIISIYLPQKRVYYEQKSMVRN